MISFIYFDLMFKLNVWILKKIGNIIFSFILGDFTMFTEDFKD